MNTNPLRVAQTGPATYILEEQVRTPLFLWWKRTTWKPVLEYRPVTGCYILFEWAIKEFPSKEAAEAWIPQLQTLRRLAA